MQIRGALGEKAYHILIKAEVLQQKIGVLFKYIGSVFVNRQDKQSRKQAKDELVKMLLHGGNVLIFPEGTMANNKLKDTIHTTIINADAIPKKEPVIFICNHRHEMDQYFIIAATKRVIHWGAKEEYFNGKDTLFGKPSKISCILTTVLLRLIGTVCIDRYGYAIKATTEMIDYLKVGSCVGVFPEGTRNKSKEELLPFKKGATMMAKKTRAWLQPCAITGDFTKNNKNLVISFRRPFKVRDMSDEQATEMLRSEVVLALDENKKWNKLQK